MKTSPTLHLRFIPALIFVGAACFFIQQLHLRKPSMFRRTPSVARGVVHPLLHRQALSHYALHSQPFQVYLASLFEGRAVCIVGVEAGADVLAFARNGYRVHGVEPSSRYVNDLRRRLEGRAGLDVRLHRAAAASRAGETIRVQYTNGNISETVRTARVDGLVHERLAALSVDIQGAELDALRGAGRLLAPGGADSVWVEVGCRPDTEKLLRLLDGAGYALFDFVPWGAPRAGGEAGKAGVRGRFAMAAERPGEIGAWVRWLCSERDRRFEWLQTDVVAVRREVVRDVWGELAAMGERVCGQRGVRCELRSLSGL